MINFALKSRLSHISLQPFLICLSLATWLYAAQIGAWNSERNRYHDFWGRTDTLAVVLGVLGVTLVFWLAYLIISRMKWPIMRSIGQYLFVLLLADAVISWGVSTFVGVGFTAKYDWIFIAIWSLIAGVLYVFRRFAFEAGKTLALITSPLPGLALLLILSWSGYEPSQVVQTPVRQVVPPSFGFSAPPVYIFVFDEWSYERSFQAGNPRPELENLAAFASTATVFHAATAPANSTFESLPRIVFQQAEGRLSPSDGRLFWEVRDQKKAVSDLPTLFDGLLEQGYRAKLIGFYHPYPLLLHDKGIAAQGFPNDPKSPSLSGRTCELAVFNLQFLTDPVSRELYRRIMARHFCRHWSQLVNHFLCETQTILAEGGSHEAAFFHWPLPHAPFIFDEDGRYLGPYDPYCERMYGTPAQYERHLRFLDCVIGQIMDQLKQRDRFEESLIVLTSDHSWRRETDPGLKAKSRDCRHVPLLVKFPGQSSRLDRDDPFPLARLRELIDGAVSTR